MKDKEKAFRETERPFFILKILLAWLEARRARRPFAESMAKSEPMGVCWELLEKTPTTGRISKFQ
jgi:hypothetical protein